MGTHPIFESDFDCLTDKMTMKYLRLRSVRQIANSHILMQSKSLEEQKIENEIRKRIKKSITSHQENLRSKYNFEYNNQYNTVNGWLLYSTEQMGSTSFANKQHALKEIGPIWKSLPESERNHWEEKAEIENEKRAEANRPAILEALKNDDILALTNHEFKKYKPNQQFI